MADVILQLANVFIGLQERQLQIRIPRTKEWRSSQQATSVSSSPPTTLLVSKAMLCANEICLEFLGVATVNYKSYCKFVTASAAYRARPARVFTVAIWIKCYSKFGH